MLRAATLSAGRSSLARSFATAAATGARDGYRVVVVGGGAGGITVAAKLANSPGFSGAKEIAVIEPSATHYYQPLWTLVGAGIKSINDSARPTADVIPHSTDWVQARVTKIDPVKKTVSTDSGRTIQYDALVLAPGINLDWAAIPGLVQTLGKDGVASNYSAEYAPRTWEFIRGFQGGNAVFTQPATAIKCAGAPQKIAYLAEEHWSKAGIRDKANISFHTGMGKIFSQDDYAAALSEVAKSKGISVDLNSDLAAIRPESREAVFRKGGNEHVVKYDFLHVTPPMSAPKFIAESDLGNAQGFADVDQYTLQHKKYPDVFALGDSSSLPTSKTAAAVSSQAKVLYANLLNRLTDPAAPLYNRYDGYTACPLTTSKDKLLLAEFSGYNMEKCETFEGVLDQTKEQSVLAPLKTTVFPWIYWNRMLTGSWDGPRTIRNAIQGFWIGDKVYSPDREFFAGKKHAHDHH